MRISGSNAGYTTFRGSVKGTDYPLHSQVPLHFPTRASPCAITFQLESTIQNAPFIVSLSTSYVARGPRQCRLRGKAPVLGDTIKKKHLHLEVQLATQTVRPLKVSRHNRAHNSNYKNSQTLRFHHYLVEQLGNAGFFRSTYKT